MNAAVAVCGVRLVIVRVLIGRESTVPTSRRRQRAQLVVQTVNRWRHQRLLVLVAEAQVIEVNIDTAVTPSLWQRLTTNNITTFHIDVY